MFGRRVILTLKTNLTHIQRTPYAQSHPSLKPLPKGNVFPRHKNGPMILRKIKNKKRIMIKHGETFYGTAAERHLSPGIPVSILNKSIAGRYRPVRVADGSITARCRFIKNASWNLTPAAVTKIKFINL